MARVENVKPIIVRSSAGFANRVFGLLFVLSYAQKSKSCIYVDWSDGMYAPRGANAFQQTFRMDGVLETPRIPQLLRPFPPRWAGRLHSTASEVSSEVSWEQYPTAFAHIDDWHLYSQRFDGYVTSCNVFPRKLAYLLGLEASPRNIFRRYLDWTPAMAAVIEKRVLTDESWCGVHFRATDVTCTSSVARVAQMITERGCAKVFWATDNPTTAEEARAMLKVRFASSQIQLGTVERGQPLHYSLSDDMRRLHLESVVCDLVSLSRCGTVLVTRGSTFSRLACEVLGDSKNQEIIGI
jgi:hypothetical protein